MNFFSNMDGGAIIIIFIIAIIIFFAIRDIICWYWKINNRVSLLEESVELQKKTLEIQTQIGNLLVNLITESQKTREEILKNSSRKSELNN